MKIIGDGHLIKEYGIVREKFKINRALYKDQYQRLNAKIDVQLNLLGEKTVKKKSRKLRWCQLCCVSVP